MSMKENQVVPGTLADVIITFSLAGYHDSQLKELVTNAASSGRFLATTSFVSARQSLPDAFYSLAHNGNLNWDVSEDMLVLAVGTWSFAQPCRGAPTHPRRPRDWAMLLPVSN